MNKKVIGPRRTHGSTISISQGTVTALNNLAALCFIISERDKKVRNKYLASNIFIELDRNKKTSTSITAIV